MIKRTDIHVSDKGEWVISVFPEETEWVFHVLAPPAETQDAVEFLEDFDRIFGVTLMPPEANEWNDE